MRKQRIHVPIIVTPMALLFIRDNHLIPPNPNIYEGLFEMLESAIKETELEKVDIMLVKNILEIGIQDDYADKIAADYIETLARAKSDKNSLLYKSSKVKECYRQSDLHKSINRIIYKIEPLRVAIMRESLALQQAVAEGNKEIADEIIKVVVRMKLEKSKLEKNLSALMGNVKKLQLAS